MAHGPARGYAANLFSIVCFTAMGLLVRDVRDVIGPATAMFWRSALGFWLVVFVGLVTRVSFVGQPRLRWKLLLRASAGAISLFAFFTAINLIDLGTATALCCTNVLFASLLSSAFLGEKLGPVATAGVIISWIGMAVMTSIRPNVGWGELSGLVAGAFSGVAMFALRDVRASGETTLAVLAFFLSFSSLVALPLAFFESPTLGLDRGIWSELVGIAFSATLAQGLLTISYKHLTTRHAASLALLVVPCSTIGAFFFYGEFPPSGSAFGGAVLLVGLLLVILAPGRPSPPPIRSV